METGKKDGRILGRSDRSLWGNGMYRVEVFHSERWSEGGTAGMKGGVSGKGAGMRSDGREIKQNRAAQEE